MGKNKRLEVGTAICKGFVQGGEGEIFLWLNPSGENYCALY